MHLIDRLKSRGWRLTAQRRAIADTFSGPSIHLTPEEVWVRARVAVPEVSQATVYNTLHELVRLGELREVDGLGRSRRYDPNTHAPHHHLLCDGCDRLVDVFPEGDLLASLPAASRHGFSGLQAEVVYRGTCPDCAPR
jgi:Fur family transcriptional regulator, stress-responsive regulator